MSEKYSFGIDLDVTDNDLEYYSKDLDGDAQIIIGREGQAAIETTPAQIYAALDAVGREVVVDIIEIDKTCIPCKQYIWDMMDGCRLCLEYDGYPDKCPGTGEYEVVLRKKGGMPDE